MTSTKNFKSHMTLKKTQKLSSLIEEIRRNNQTSIMAVYQKETYNHT